MKKSGTNTKRAALKTTKRRKSVPLLKDASLKEKPKRSSVKPRKPSRKGSGSTSKAGDQQISRKSAAGTILASLIKVPALSLTILVDRPQSKQSTQFGRGHAFTPKNKKKYLKYLADEFRKCYTGDPLSGTFFLEIVYFFKRSKSHYEMELMNNCADVVDNLNKPVCDAMQKVVIEDDKQICGALVFKARSKTPRIEVNLFRVLGTK